MSQCIHTHNADGIIDEYFCCQTSEWVNHETVIWQRVMNLNCWSRLNHGLFIETMEQLYYRRNIKVSHSIRIMSQIWILKLRFETSSLKKWSDSLCFWWECPILNCLQVLESPVVAQPWEWGTWKLVSQHQDKWMNCSDATLSPRHYWWLAPDKWAGKAADGGWMSPEGLHTHLWRVTTSSALLRADVVTRQHQ